MTTITPESASRSRSEAPLPAPQAAVSEVSTAQYVKPRLTLRWWARQLATIVLVHVFILVLTLFLMAAGEALYTTYIILLQNTVFVAYVTQSSWLRDMASDLRGGVALTVAASGFLQMLLLTWRAATS